MKKSTPVSDGFTPPDTSTLVMLGSDLFLSESSFNLDIEEVGLPTIISLAFDFVLPSTLDSVLTGESSSAITLYVPIDRTVAKRNIPYLTNNFTTSP